MHQASSIIEQSGQLDEMKINLQLQLNNTICFYYLDQLRDGVSISEYIGICIIETTVNLILI